MTSLAAQLQRLSVPHTQTVWSYDNRRASLLFDPKEAANLDRQAVYAIGISGLEELEGLDDVFGEYANSLFNLTSQAWERTLQTGEVNKRLNEVIERFLTQLSPYFLLKCAHKALEWLIYRYHIHQMNIDALLRCVFPYHETKIFVRVVQLLPIEKETHKWNWIHSAGKSGAPLTRTVIINHCRADPSFLTFLCDLVTTSIRVLGSEGRGTQPVVALWSCTMLGVTAERSQLNEKVMSVLVPALTRGLKSKCVDYKAASYMLLAQIATHSTLQPELVTSLLHVLTKNISPKLTREALMCLALLCKTQKLTQITKKSFKKICRLPALVPLLSTLSEKYDMNNLISCFLSRLIPAAVKTATSAMLTSSSAVSDDEFGQSGATQYDALLTGIFSDVSMDTNMATTVTSLLLEELVGAVDAGRAEDEWKSASQAFLSILQARYAVSVDLAVEKIVKSSKGGASLQAVLQAAVGGAKGRLIDGSTSLLLALNHAHAATRVLAVRHLRDVLKDDPSVSDDDLADSLVLRLRDDDNDVVTAVLDIGQKLYDVVPKSRLSEALLNLLQQRSNNVAWSSISARAASIVCAKPMAGVTPDAGLRLLPYLLLADSAHLTTPLAILRSEVAAHDPILKTFCKKWVMEAEKKSATCDALNAHLVKGVATAIINDTTLCKRLSDFSAADTRLCLLTLCALTKALTDPNALVTTEIVSALLHLVSNNINKLTQLTTFSTDDTMTSYITEWMTSVRPDDVTVPAAAIWWALKAVVMYISSNEQKLPDTAWWSVEEFVSVVIMTLDALVRVSCYRSKAKQQVWHELVHALTQESLSLKSLSRLAATVLIQHISPSSHQVAAVTQVAMIHLLARRWQVTEKNELVKLLEEPGSSALPVLLLCLGSKEELIRVGAIMCVKAARKVNKDIGRCAKLFKKIFKQQEEIHADPDHVNNILWRVLKDDAALCDLILRPVLDPVTPLIVRERLTYHLQITPNECIMERLVPMGTEILAVCASSGKVTPLHMTILRHLVERLGTEDAPGLSVKSAVFKFLLAALRTKHEERGTELPASVVLSQMSRAMFRELPSNAERNQLVTAILDVGENPPNADVSNHCNRALQQLHLEWDHIQHELTPQDPTPATPTTVKSRRRSRAVAGSASRGSLSWRRVTFLLEVLQLRKSMKDSEPCVSAMFTLLAKLQSEEGEELEYRQRLVLAVIHTLTNRWQQQLIQPKQESVNVEVLVTVVRNPRTSTQTKQHALGVMADLAFYFPEHLLHHVMSIFTFVGTGLLAADDEHSLKVVSRTITTIIPALLGAKSNTEKAADQLTNQIVQVFVDAQRSIPRHRSLAVFTTLMTTLGAETSLWRVLTLLITTATMQKDNEPMPGQDVNPDSVTGSMEMDMQFGISICEQFGVSAIVETATQLVQFLQWLAEQHETLGDSPTKGKHRRRSKSANRFSLVVDIKALTGYQLRLLQFHLTRLLTRLLSMETLITQVIEGEEAMGTLFHAFVKEAVVYMLAVARTHNALISTSHSKFWKVIMGKAYEVIDKVLYLLPTHVLLEVVSGLLDLDLHGVRRKSLELLASKLQALLVTPPREDQHGPLLEIVDRLVQISTSPNRKQDVDVTAGQQMALFNIKLMCKILGDAHQAKFVTVLKSVMPLVSVSGSMPVVGNALLVEAEIVSVVRAHAIPYLPKLITPLLDLLSDHQFTAEHDLVLTCGLTALHRAVITLPHFLSPYLRRILTTVCQLDSVVQDPDKKQSQAVQRLAAIKQQVATVVASRVLVPALGETFNDVLTSSHVSQMSLTSVMSVAKEHVSHISREDLTSQQTPLLDLFCVALDLRNTNLKLTDDGVRGVEEAVIEALLAMVVRLSEASFRPMFYKLYDWGCREDTEEARRRRLTFFRLADTLAGKLRSLFNLFIGQTLQAAATVLTANNSLHGAVDYYGESGSASSCELLGYVLDCLTKCMRHDAEGGFTVFSGDVFNMLLQPLVDQMENFVGRAADYETRMSQHVVPCLSHFMVAAKEDSHQKALNYQVLLKARNVSPKVRFTALRVISGAAVQMGDDYVLLIPETIPFLAELMEDECEEVERECQTVIAKLEEVLGESLQKYF